MRKVKKKNILKKINDTVSDKIDKFKQNKNEKKEKIKEKKEKIKEKKVKSKVKQSKKEENIKKITKKETQGKNLKKDNLEEIIVNEEIVINEEDNLEDILEVKKTNESPDEEVVEVKKRRKLKKNLLTNLPFLKKESKSKKVKKIKNKKATSKDNSKKKRPIWKKIVTVFLILCIAGVLSVTAFLGYIVLTAPDFSDSALTSKEQTIIYDIDGNVIATLGTQKRENITYDKLPQVLIDAIIATEDSRFFEHNGVDLFRFIKATVQQLIGQDAGGASTLTMQIVKNNLTKQGKIEKTKIDKIVRKFQDVYLAVFKVEKKYSKEEILEIYVNDNGLGSSYYGVEEASKYYFGKSVEELTLPEAALIAGLFQAPGRHNPYLNIESATARRSTVLKLMERHGYITKAERIAAEKVSIESLLVGTNASDNVYQGFIDTVIAEVAELTKDADGHSDDPYTVPMKIYTTMEKSIQDGVNSVYAKTDSNIWRDDVVQGGVAIVNAETGGISAVGAGRNRTGERQFNYATQAYRQPGSTAKPVFDYGPGIEYLNYSSYQLFVDEPWSYTNGPSVGNWDGDYKGIVTARYALQFSRNVPALKAFQQVGPKNSQKFAYSLGLNVSLNSNSENYKVFESGVDNTINEAYSIGGVAGGFTPLNMANAYACFANGGYYIKSHAVTKITYRETGEEKEYKYNKERVMKDSTAYIMNNILESAVTGGFSGGANIYGSHVAAKTGTSNYDAATMAAHGLPGRAINDLWTVAYTSKYSVAVWYGYKEIDSDYYNTESVHKTNFTNAIMKYIPKDTTGWSMPSSVVAVTVEKDTWPAALPSEYTPNDMKITEYFVRGTQPTEVSERYKKLNSIKSQKTTKDGNTVTITWDYDTPKQLTKEYLETYFSNSVFANSKDRLVNARLDYNSNTLGEVGFGIYKKENDGTLTLIDFTTDKKYTYKGYGNVTLVIKAEHKSFKSNASDGVEIPLSLDGFNEKDVEVTFATNGIIQAEAGKYEEAGFKTITYKKKDISNNITLRYSISTGTETYATAKDFEKVVNTLEAGTYTISYKFYYLDNEIIRYKQLTLK